MSAVHFVDVDGNGVDEGDLLVVTFDGAVYITSTEATAFVFDSTLDTLGTAPTQSQSVAGATRVEVVLGAAASFQPATSLLNVRSSSSLNVRGTSGSAASTATASLAVLDRTATAPTLVAAYYDDVDLDGTINVGDTVLCEFDKPIAIGGTETVAGNFSVPVTSDSFGAGASLTAFTAGAGNRCALITLGTSPVLTVSGTFDAGTTTAGSPSGIVTATPGITDVNLANTATDAISVDLGIKTSRRFLTGLEASLFPGNLDALTPDVGANGFFSPGGVHHFDGSMTLGGNTVNVDLLFVADTDNHRVLIFDGKPNGNNASAAVVLGQADLNSNLANQSSASAADPTASTLWSPADVHFDATSNQLYVSDTGNHRILVFDAVVDNLGTLDLTDGVAADRVLGQPTFTSRQANQGANAPTSRSLRSPKGIHVDDGQVAVADSGNNRVLVWSSIPSASNAAASTVLGQSSFVLALANQGGAASASSLSGPEDVFIDADFDANGSSGALLIADTGNHRVLVFETASPATGASADVALGQANLTATTAATTATGLNGPTGVYGVAGGTDRIYVADRSNHRVMVYSFDGAVGGDLTNGESGVAIGQADNVTGTSNQGGTPSLSTMSSPSRVTFGSGSMGSDLFVADTDNHRVLDYLALPTANGTAADLFQGQTMAASSDANGHRMNQPQALAISAGMLFVADTLNHRCLIYNTIPTAGDPAPDLYVGQANGDDTLANQGGTAALGTLSAPGGIATDGTRLIVADTGNNRVLIFNTIPVADGTAADLVLGQANGTTSTANAGGVSGARMSAPTAVFVSGTQLFVCDRDNHRVLVFDDITTVATGAAADWVIGQDDFVSNLPNHGGEVAADRLDSPGGVAIVGSALLVADTGNHRVLGWSAVPSSNGTDADFALGQANLLANAASTGTKRMSGPTGIASDGTGLLIADTDNNRVLFYATVPTTTNASPSNILGQSGFGSGTANQGSATPSASSLSSPMGLFFDGTDGWVVDQKNSRLARFR
ncbi:MAG: NHL repeat-containing protein [Planctomycetota bacterium]